MNAELLLEHYERIAEAPDAIARLRRFVLDLAVRGKLVEQDLSDEHASELLKRIKANAQDGQKRRGKARDTSARNALEEIPFEAPTGWTFASLGDLVRVLNGRAYKQQELLDKGVPVLRVGNLFTSNHWYYSDLALDDDKHCEAGDLIYAWSASFGPFIWNGPRVIYHYHIWKLPLVSEADLDKRYLYNFLLQKTREIKDAGHGISMVHMTKEKMEKLLVPLPPLTEQHRIVAKVDELMALCDQLEAARAEREAGRNRLTLSTLAKLNEPDPETFADDARFALEHLEPLTKRTDQIKQLRQTILNIAVRGKLVAQDPADEPASQLLKRIEADKLTLLKAGEANSFRQLAPASLNDLSFGIPSHWEPVRVGQILNDLQTGPFGSSLHQSDYRIGGTPVINPASLQNERIVPIEKMAIGLDTLERLASFKLRYGDIVLARRGEMGRCAIVTDREVGWLCGTGSLILRPAQALYARFLVMLIGSPFGRQYLGGSAVGSTMQNLNQTILLGLPFGLPPFNEQKRIVAKVDELMALCDQLEASLNEGEQARSKLLQAVLHEALEPA